MKTLVIANIDKGFLEIRTDNSLIAIYFNGECIQTFKNICNAVDKFNSFAYGKEAII